MELAFGRQYLFERSVVMILCINFFINGTRKAVLTFRDSMGLFWFDRYKALAEAALNLVLSILLVRQYQTLGVFIGTFFVNDSHVGVGGAVCPVPEKTASAGAPVLSALPLYAVCVGAVWIVTDLVCGLAEGSPLTVLSHPAAALCGAAQSVVFLWHTAGRKNGNGVGAPATHRVGRLHRGRNVMRQQMEEEQWNLCRLLDAALHGRPAEMLPPAEKIRSHSELADRHRVLPLLYDVLAPKLPGGG